MRPRDVTEILRHFDQLPDWAVVPQKVTALLIGESARSLRRKKPIPSFPINRSLKGNRVGDIRKLVRESEGREGRICRIAFLKIETTPAPRTPGTVGADDRAKS